MWRLIGLAIALLSVNASAQNKLYQYQIKGAINIDSGNVALGFIADSSYYPSVIKKLIVPVRHNQFFFEGEMPSPQAFKLTAYFPGGEYNSGLFIIAPGVQTVVCDTHANMEAPTIGNDIMQNDFKVYVGAFKEMADVNAAYTNKKNEFKKEYPDKLPDSIKLYLQEALKKLYSKHDSVFLNYVVKNPNSYVGLWELVFLSNFGYEDIFDAIYGHFSDSIKNTYTGRILGTRIKSSSVLSAGKKFPYVDVANNDNEKLSERFYSKNKFTLVDFWYSHCGPCVAQFDDLKNTYQQFRDKGFEIVAISTDAVKYRSDWQKRIHEKQLPWLQYWDKDGIKASNLSINAFPTNYLLDSTGQILQKDLRPAELANFLKMNLK